MAWERVLGNSAGTMSGSGTRKLLLHTTEGTTIEGAIGAYRQHNSWPHLTVDCKRRRIVQHVEFNQAARSLRNSAGGVETNRQGTILVQVEIVGFAERPETIGSAADLEWFGREVVAVVCRRHSIPISTTVRWVAYPASYGLRAAQRLTGAQWNGYSGILAHQHAPENDHGDTGALDIERILTAARGDDDVTDADITKIANKVIARIEAELDETRSVIRQKIRELAKLGADDALDARETPEDPPAG